MSLIRLLEAAPDAQRCAGEVIAYTGGKHVVLGRRRKDGAFELTEDGEAVVAAFDARIDAEIVSAAQPLAAGEPTGGDELPQWKPSPEDMDDDAEAAVKALLED